MTRVTLTRTGVWELGEVIGSGGDGEVYRATSEAHRGNYVIKLIPKRDVAFRELRIAEHLRGKPNIIPVLDSGETDDKTHYALLMPEAEGSLRKFIEEVRRPTPPVLALPILINIAYGLVVSASARVPGQQEKGVVHRDLKPENVLFWNGEWCLSDFGIARYIDELTAMGSRRYRMTPHYAAPEQWRGETATAKTDVYASGIIAYELLIGSRPFTGPELRQQHLDDDVPPMPGVPPSLANLVNQCLYKHPGARPSPEALVQLLERQISPGQPERPSINVLHSASLIDTARRDQEVRRAQREREITNARGSLINVAFSEWNKIGSALKRLILENVPGCTETKLKGGGWQLELNSGVLIFSDPKTQEHGDRFSEMPFNVVSCGYIAVDNLQTRGRGFEGRAHSLWFCDSQVAGDYRWFETAFSISNPGARGDDDHVPRYDFPAYMTFAAGLSDKAAYSAFIPRLSFEAHEVVWPFSPVVPGDLDEFIDRWVTWFGDAAHGRSPRQSFTSRRNRGPSWRQPLPDKSTSLHSATPPRSPYLYTRSPHLYKRRGIQLAAIVLIVAAVISIVVFAIQTKNKNDAQQAAQDAAAQAALEKAAAGSQVDCYVVLSGDGTTEQAVDSGKRYSCNAVPMANRGTGDPYWTVISLKGISSSEANRHYVDLYCTDHGLDYGAGSYFAPKPGIDIHAAVAGMAGGPQDDPPKPIDCVVRNSASILRSFTITLKRDVYHHFGS